MATTTPKMGITFQNGIPGRPNSAGHPGYKPAIQSSGPSRNSPTTRGRGARGGRGCIGRGGGTHRPDPIVGSSTTEEAECRICDRPKVDVRCLACGWFGAHMRVRKICPVPSHAKYTYVQDLNCCPNCKMNNLEEHE